ncbi:MAG: molecular chaperone TorD family protein [Anaerolineales bacterium]|nr:molecular chaperone TorD family protein [Anaerolineales bacterium]
MKESQKNDERGTILLGEALLFGLLGRILYDQLDKAWLQSLIDEDVFSEAPFGAKQRETALGLDLLQKWSQENSAGISDESFDEWRSDYTSLFVGVGEVLAPPWESVYFSEERLVFQEQTLQVREWYRRFGVEPEKLHKEPDDHIGLELTFVSYLSKLALQALEDQDEEKYEKLLDAQRQFISKHLLRWGTQWCNLVGEHARTDFYKGLAFLTRGALLALAEQYDIQIPDTLAK